MSGKETFEDILKSKLSEREFSFDEENWEEAEEMIASFRQKEKIKKGTFIFLAGLVLGIVIMLPFINITNKKTQPLISQNNKKSVKSIVTEDGQTQSSNVPASVSNKMQETDSATVPAEKSAQTSYQENNSIEKITITDNEKKSSKPSFSAVGKTSENKDNSLPTQVFKQKKNTTKKQSPSASIAAPHNGIGNNNQTAIPTKTSQTTETSVDKNHENVTTLKDTTTNNITLNTDVKNVTDSITKSDSSSLITASAKDSVLKDSVAVAKKDSTIKSIAEKPIENVPFDKTWKVAVAVGGNYLIAGTLNPIQGIELMKPITLNWAVSTGLYYTYINIKGTNAVKTIITNTAYDFGYTSDVVQIKTNELHYIVVPVCVQRTINEKNNVVLGVNNYMLLTVSNNYSTYKESYGNKQNVNSSKKFGYSNGFNPYDIGLLMGYRRTLFYNLGIGVYMNYGLMNINKKDYYKEKIVDRNISGQIMLTYRLR